MNCLYRAKQSDMMSVIITKYRGAHEILRSKYLQAITSEFSNLGLHLFNTRTGDDDNRYWRESWRMDARA